jgi:pyruvate ferredoxin oxidoreductase gamma subunit
MKTASRIVGTAAFRQGYHAQDAPVYGAERRGAPMMAFTRIDDRPVLERGIITSPDLIVIADASLIDDPLVRPLQGLSAGGCALINSASVPKAVNVPTVVRDYTSLAMSHAGTTSALSVALGAAAARLAGLNYRFVEEAVREELEELKLAGAAVERNAALARACFEGTAPYALHKPGIASPAASEVRVIQPSYDGGWAGTASVSSVPNTPLRKTGDWRVMRPVIDLAKCSRCWVCFLNCPDGAVLLGEGDIPQIDYSVCKGCMICAEECPVDAIETRREAEAK